MIQLMISISRLRMTWRVRDEMKVKGIGLNEEILLVHTSSAQKLQPRLAGTGKFRSRVSNCRVQQSQFEEQLLSPRVTSHGIVETHLNPASKSHASHFIRALPSGFQDH